MIGNQIINTLLELFGATRRTITRNCCNRDEKEAKQQWQLDRALYDFNSDTLTEEYMELGRRYLFIYSINLLLFILVIQFGFVTLFVVAFP